MAYDAQTLSQLAIFSTSPNGVDGGVWGSGGGIAADTSGNIYASTADGTFDADQGGADYAPTARPMVLFGPSNIRKI